MSQLKIVSQRKPDYRFYATLLDSYQWYLNDESETAFQDFINKLNRVPFSSEAADKGTAFNTVVDMVMRGDEVKNEGGLYIHGRFGFDEKLVNDYVANLSGAVSQVRVNGYLQTELGLVELYGDIDEMCPACVVVDIKTTKQYTFPKYLRNWQHVVYPFCLNQQNKADYTFSYMVTDFKEIYTESYSFNPEKDTQRLRLMCERLIDFIETYRHLITDTKLFQDPEAIAA